MGREAWKKVLGSIPDGELVDLIDIWKIQVKGFRQITKDNIQTVRSMAILEALKPKNLNMIKHFYDTFHHKENPDGKDINLREESVESLKQLYEECSVDLHIILGVLYSSEEKLHHLKARKLEDSLLEEHGANSISELNVTNKNASSEQVQLTLEPDEELEWEKKKRKSEEKNEKLQKTIDKWEKQYTELKNKYKEEKQQWAKERAQLQQDLGREKSNVSGANEKLALAEAETGRLKETIQTLKAEISHLNALLLSSNTRMDVESAKDQGAKKPSHIALVGDPRNKLTEESEDPIFHVFGPKDINEALEKNVFQDFDEVWIMCYLVPPQMKKKIKKIHNQKIVEFMDFPSMKSYIKKGR
ncbi:hypothetical protein [Neobacillus sp. 114]|uniref:hypothetical protein n=1 Tax=Neobacillus sp. 114 TaxID=3048535 RepID=UPI0024C2C2AD|nr:hypothetical protein [Neobacillus sp. 114]